MCSMQVREHVSAPRPAVYRALLDPEAIRQWRAPAGMTVTTTLTDAAGGTDILVVFDGIPDAVPPADNETRTRMSLASLAEAH
jgi:uncharacterized protein YndB with AHSA1/START domain